ncbi:MAG TPA: alpha/beta hydrolase [Acidimicrobiales bacterium]|nr:alpha/beta hydrolase [Acidimicrobiales bacterium]
MDLREPDRAGFVELNRTRLRLWEWGEEAAPPVICAHGAFDHGRMFDGLAPRLADLGLRVVAPDLRGHGDSGRLSSGHVWTASALDLALLARHLGPPVGLVGHSFGGGQALHVAGVWPELVRWVVNLDGLGPPPAAFEEVDLVASAQRGLAAAEKVRSRPPRVYATLEEMVERRRGVNVRLPPAWVEHLVHHGAAPVEGGWVWKADPMFNIGLPGDFDLDQLNAEHEMVACPVLVLTGAEHDTWSEMSDDELAQRLAHLVDARHVVVEGAGHYVHVEQPDAVATAVAAFLAEVGR